MAVLVWALLWAGCSYAEASLYRISIFQPLKMYKFILPGNLTEELQAFFHQSMERSWNLPDGISFSDYFLQLN